MRITENQKRNIKFKTYTCMIDVLGNVKEVTYNNVIWVSSDKKWVFYVNESEHFQIEKINDFVTDFPLLYDNGTVIYDNPQNIPKYIRDRIRKTLLNLSNYIGDVKMKEYDINFGKYISEENSIYLFWSRIQAESETEALEKLYKIYRNIVCVLSVTEL